LNESGSAVIINGQLLINGQIIRPLSQQSVNISDTEMRNSFHMEPGRTMFICFWNNLYQVQSKPKYMKDKKKSLGARKSQVLNKKTTGPKQTRQRSAKVIYD
jgi:hypothetical protein